MISKLILVIVLFALCASQNNKENNNELQSMKRNACLLIARNYLHSKQSDLEGLLKDIHQT